MTAAQAFRDLLTASGLSAAEAGRRLGVSAVTVRRWLARAACDDHHTAAPPWARGPHSAMVALARIVLVAPATQA